MRSAIDSSVLLDILLQDSKHAESSLKLLEGQAARGSLVICPVVYAEVASAFTPTSRFRKIAEEMDLIYDDFSREVALLAAQMWQAYRRSGGSRTRILSDFLVGAHAQLRADVLLTRDRGYYRSHFQGLRVVSP